MVDKKINVSNILMATMIAVSVLWWAAQIEKRIAVLEVELKAFYKAQLNSKSIQLYRDDKQDSEVDKLEKIMLKNFDSLNNKIDHIQSQ